MTLCRGAWPPSLRTGCSMEQDALPIAYELAFARSPWRTGRRTCAGEPGDLPMTYRVQGDSRERFTIQHPLRTRSLLRFDRRQSPSKMRLMPYVNKCPLVVDSASLNDCYRVRPQLPRPTRSGLSFVTKPDVGELRLSARGGQHPSHLITRAINETTRHFASRPGTTQ